MTGPLATEEQIIEALLFSSPEPLISGQLKRISGIKEIVRIREIIKNLNAFYKEHARPYRIHRIAGGYQLRTEKRFQSWIVKTDSIKPIRLSGPVLETLSIVAYKQPVTRGMIEGIRTVDCGYSLRSLLEKNLIFIAGRAELPGRPLLYRTSNTFLELFGFKNLADLPRPEEYDLDVVEA